MITKDIYGRYDEFFKQVNDLLKLDGDDIVGDINDYFTVLGDIRDKVTKEGADPYFLILPNDEPLLKIDANTRKIDTKGWEAGIGTQGDELAEIIYFSIDRYFDTADLYDKDIFVQWENAVGDAGLSATINKTVNYLSAPNKLVFGWPITSDITKSAGNIKFAVRFYTRNNPSSGEEYKLYYSLGTITATLKVNPSLDMSIENPDTTDYIDKKWIIYEMMRNSTVPGLDVTAVAPTFETPTPAFNQAFNLGDEELPFKIRAKFDSKDDKSGMGTISYSWYHLDKNQENKIALNETDGVLDVYIENTDTSRDEYDRYYTKNAKGEYITYTGSIPSEEGVEVYKLFATLTPNKAGYYYAVATNKAGRGNQKESESGRWLIAFAVDPQFEYPNNIKHTIIPASGEGATLSPTVTVSDNGELSYQWYLHTTQDGEPEKLAGKIDASLSEIIREGYYSLEVTNNKNNSKAVVMSDDMRVTFPAGDITNPIFWLNDIDSKVPGGTFPTAKAGDILKIEHGVTHSDTINYQWYKNDAIIDGEVANKYTIPSTGGGGIYKVAVTNIYNGNTKTEEYSITVITI